MVFRRYLAVVALGLLLLLNGCTQKPAWLGSSSGNVKENPSDLKYAASIDVNQAGLRLDFLNENITVSPDGKQGVLVASTVPKGKTPKGQQVGYDSYLVLVDLINGSASFLDKGQYIGIIQWSPRGDKILYRKDDSLYISDSSGAEKHKIAGRAYCGAVSPDGTRVAFVQRGKGLFISGVDGTGVRRLTGEPGDWYPVWYPDGQSLFYFADRHIELGEGAGRLQGLGRIDVATGQTEVLIPEEKGKYRRAEWIISGKTLLVNKGWDDGFYEMIVNVEKGEIYQLGENAGTRMYSTSIDKAGGLVYKAQGSTITKVDDSGQKGSPLTLNQPQGLRFSRDSGAVVSPDGKLLAYLSPEKSGSGKADGRQVWVVNSDGTKPISLTGDFSGSQGPVWTPDSRHIVTVDISRQSGKQTFTVKVLPVNRE